MENNPPILTLSYQPGSHQFEERRIALTDSPIKIGRAVARTRPSESNGIFDCKVLSRNHAVISYENDRVFLRDTNSSNGTFVNNNQILKSNEDAQLREIFSGDIIQFGVEVTENLTTHGCIISRVSIFRSDGSELKRQADQIAENDCSKSLAISEFQADLLENLKEHLQEALYQEEIMNLKIEAIQTIMIDLKASCSKSWKVLMIEEKLVGKLKKIEARLEQIEQLNQPEFRENKVLLETLQNLFNYQLDAKKNLLQTLEEKQESMISLMNYDLNLQKSQRNNLKVKSNTDLIAQQNESLNEKLSECDTEINALKLAAQELETRYQESIAFTDNDCRDTKVKCDESKTKKTEIYQKLENARREKELLNVTVEEIRKVKQLCPIRIVRNDSENINLLHSKSGELLNQFLKSVEEKLNKKRKQLKIDRITLTDRNAFENSNQKIPNEIIVSLRKLVDQFFAKIPPNQKSRFISEKLEISSPVNQINNSNISSFNEKQRSPPLTNFIHQPINALHNHHQDAQAKLIAIGEANKRMENEDEVIIKYLRQIKEKDAEIQRASAENAKIRDLIADQQKSNVATADNKEGDSKNDDEPEIGDDENDEFKVSLAQLENRIERTAHNHDDDDNNDGENDEKKTALYRLDQLEQEKTLLRRQLDSVAQPNLTNQMNLESFISQIRKITTLAVVPLGILALSVILFFFVSMFGR